SDPDSRPRPNLAMDGESRPAFRLLLAHNPKIAPLAEQAGFDLQLSEHTHAGQFFPWTFVIHLVHGPHAAGLSRRARLRVYVSGGTGTWGPAVRLGTRPELTLVRPRTPGTPKNQSKDKMGGEFGPSGVIRPQGAGRLKWRLLLASSWPSEAPQRRLSPVLSSDS